MRYRADLARLLASAPGWAWRAAGLWVAWLAVASVALGWGLPEVMLSRPAAWLEVLVAALLLTGAAAPLLTPGEPRLRRAGPALRRAGLGLLVLALPLSLFGREEQTLRVGEGMVVPAGELDGLPELAFGEATVAPRADGLLLSKTVSIEATAAGEPRSIGLWPPTAIGPWRLAVVRFGFAPALRLVDPAGRELADGIIMLGALEKTEADARLFTWTPPPVVMLGVGYYPPALEDLFSPPGTRLHLFLRLASAELGGVRRDLTDPSAHLWLADGRPRNAAWRVELRDGERLAWRGDVEGDRWADLPVGRLLVDVEPRFWFELRAVRDPWLAVAGAGSALLLGGLLAGVVAWGSGRR